VVQTIYQNGIKRSLEKSKEFEHASELLLSGEQQSKIDACRFSDFYWFISSYFLSFFHLLGYRMQCF
jgi:hypothetical protein